MAKRERVWECAHAECDAYLVEGRGDSMGWQEVAVKPMRTEGVRAVKVALCPVHALRVGEE